MKQLVLAAAITVFSIPAQAGEIVPMPAPVTQAGDWFGTNRFEFELMTGLAGAPISGSHIGYHYTDSELRLGWILYAPRSSGWLRGNVELLGSIGGGAVYDGPGSKFAINDFFLRYNFIQPQARLIPYFQIGAGTFISDIAENHLQEDIGGTFEADLRAAVGAKYVICPGWSLNSELFFEHISNAGTQTRNVGINALGGLLGFSRSF
jgi:lipid A 3-O-deacylase